MERNILSARIATALFQVEVEMDIRIPADVFRHAIEAGMEISKKDALFNASTYTDAIYPLTLQNEEEDE